MTEKTSESGIWIDDATGKVVTERPEGGATQLVRPGGRLTEAIQARIDLIENPDADIAAEDGEADKTDTVEPKKSTRKK